MVGEYRLLPVTMGNAEKPMYKKEPPRRFFCFWVYKAIRKYQRLRLSGAG